MLVSQAQTTHAFSGIGIVNSFLKMTITKAAMQHSGATNRFLAIVLRRKHHHIFVYQKPDDSNEIEILKTIVAAHVFDAAGVRRKERYAPQPDSEIF